jgi:threonine synthase
VGFLAKLGGTAGEVCSRPFLGTRAFLYLKKEELFMFYRSTRSKNEEISASEAMIKGISKDGGLFVPNEIPLVTENLEDLMNMSYKELAFFLMRKYFTDFETAELKECVDRAYDGKFNSVHIAPLVEKQGVHFLELYHGPTLAFKDMALAILPHLLKTSLKKQSEKKEIVILTATSGDTGKAALEGFAGVQGIKIAVFFPKDGVSEIQKRQMLTQEGSNTFVAGIEGNFDDAQNAVKMIFNDTDFVELLNNKGLMLSSANSINIGRLIPQIVYYFHSYLTLLRSNKIKSGHSINVAVPTGNFGNILAAYYAKEMGLPIKKLICASNENNVLYDFFESGIYDRRRELKLTSSPSMDILISSNLERLLFEISGRDEKLIRELMLSLQSEGKYEISESMKEKFSEFYGGFSSEVECSEAIKSVYSDSGYIIDTHTAVAYSVYEKYKKETGDSTETIIASTASPFKFGRSVLTAIGVESECMDDFRVIEKLSAIAGIPIPQSLKELESKKVVHNNFCSKEEIKTVVQKYLKV